MSMGVNLHKSCGVTVLAVLRPVGAPVFAARRRAALHPLHLESKPFVLIVCAHSEQLVDGRVHRPLVRPQHRLDHVVVHIREHRLEVGHRLRELELHGGRHPGAPAARHAICKGRHECAPLAGDSADT